MVDRELLTFAEYSTIDVTLDIRCNMLKKLFPCLACTIQHSLSYRQTSLKTFTPYGFLHTFLLHASLHADTGPRPCMRNMLSMLDLSSNGVLRMLFSRLNEWLGSFKKLML